MKTYTLTWIQNGDYMWFTLGSTHDVSEAIQIFVDAGMDYLPESCSHNALFENDRLVARQATYQGV